MMKRIKVDDLEDSMLEEDPSLLNFFEKKEDFDKNSSGLKIPQNLF